MASGQQAEIIADNFHRVRDQIVQAAGGRPIRLVCVTKYASVDWAAALINAGATHLGENLLPQGAQKFAALKHRDMGFAAHLIGPLQSRKARLAAKTFDWYQALDQMQSAASLYRHIESPGLLNVLIQVNIAAEPQKHGVAPEGVDALAAQLDVYPALRLRGLMCIPPGPGAYTSAAEHGRATREHFRQMRRLFDRMAASLTGRPIDTLSMGMSGDYRWAIEEGSTMVRVGQALFEGLEG